MYLSDEEWTVKPINHLKSLCFVFEFLYQPILCQNIAWLLLHTNLRQDPPLDLSFWPFLTFFAPWYRRSIETSSVKTSQKNSKQKLVKCATEVARLCKVSIQSCTQNRPSLKIQSRSGDWISLFYRLDYLYETWHTCSSYSWLQNVASDFLIFALNFERS